MSSHSVTAERLITQWDVFIDWPKTSSRSTEVTRVGTLMEVNENKRLEGQMI